MKNVTSLFLCGAPEFESQVAATAGHFVAMAVGLCDRPRNTGLTVGARLAAGTMRCLRL